MLDALRKLVFPLAVPPEKRGLSRSVCRARSARPISRVHRPVLYQRGHGPRVLRELPYRDRVAVLRYRQQRRVDPGAVGELRVHERRQACYLPSGHPAYLRRLVVYQLLARRLYVGLAPLVLLVEDPDEVRCDPLTAISSRLSSARGASRSPRPSIMFSM